MKLQYILLPIACIASVSHSVSHRAKRLKELALEASGFAGRLLEACLTGSDSSFVKTDLLSQLLPQMLGFKMDHVVGKDIRLVYYTVEPDGLSGVEENITVRSRDARLVEFLRGKVGQLSAWANDVMLPREEVQSILGQCMSSMSRFASDEEKSSFELMSTVLNDKKMLAIALRNIFRRDLSLLHPSFLCPTILAFKNPELETSRNMWHPLWLSQLRNPLALSLYPEVRAPGIGEYAASFDFTHFFCPQLNTTYIQSFVSMIALARNDRLAKTLLSKIDLSMVEFPTKLWIVQHLPKDSLSFIRRHLAKWDLPEDVPMPPLRMLTRMNSVTVHEETFQPTFISFRPTGLVDIYKIPLPYLPPEKGEYLVKSEVLKPTFSTSELEIGLEKGPMLTLIFPRGVHVTARMLGVLAKWAMAEDPLSAGAEALSMEEDRLARLIILVDQVTIIKHHP